MPPFSPVTAQQTPIAQGGGFGSMGTPMGIPGFAPGSAIERYQPMQPEDPMGDLLMRFQQPDMLPSPAYNFQPMQQQVTLEQPLDFNSFVGSPQGMGIRPGTRYNLEEASRMYRAYLDQFDRSQALKLRYSAGTMYGGGYGAGLSPYQAWQVERGMRNDARTARKDEADFYKALYERERQQRLDEQRAGERQQDVEFRERQQNYREGRDTTQDIVSSSRRTEDMEIGRQRERQRAIEAAYDDMQRQLDQINKTLADPNTQLIMKSENPAMFQGLLDEQRTLSARIMRLNQERLAGIDPELAAELQGMGGSPQPGATGNVKIKILKGKDKGSTWTGPASRLSQWVEGEDYEIVGE